MKNICNWCFKTMKECDCMFTKVEPTTADEYNQEWLEQKEKNTKWFKEQKEKNTKLRQVIVWMLLGFICGILWMFILWGLTGWM
tara:strand:+ start:268 stop:519 length:252 start_codon:yes stop_codon:yes gene_type:complete